MRVTFCDPTIGMGPVMESRKVETCTVRRTCAVTWLPVLAEEKLCSSEASAAVIWAGTVTLELLCEGRGVLTSWVSTWGWRVC